MNHQTLSLKSLVAKPSQKALLFVLAILTLLSLSLIITPTTHAVTAADYSDTLTAYCRDQAKQAKNACDDNNFAGSGNNLITAAINVASYHCEGLAADKENTCITKAVKSYLRKAANDDHSSAAKFKTALHNVLDDAGGSMKHASSKSGLGGASAPTAEGADPAIAECDNDRCDFIGKYVNPFINLLTAIFGIIAVASLIVGGIQYSTSAGDPQKVSKAKQRIINTVIAIVAYFFLFGFLQFLVPGGLFNRTQ